MVLWRTSGHNPVKQLRSISQDKLEAAARDPVFLELYDKVLSKFDKEMTKDQNGAAKQTIAGQMGK